MKNSLGHLPQHKQDELALVVETIREEVDHIEMIILFGSYARGTAVEDRYVDTEDGATYEYKSDFDILVIVSSEGVIKSKGVMRYAKRRIKGLNIETPFTIITHTIDEVNNELQNGQYFFTDIKKEGIMLYNSGNFELAEAVEMSPKLKAHNATEYYEQWMEIAQDFYTGYEGLAEKQKYKLASFMLHQTCESLFSAIMLVFTNHKPKEHDLEKFMRLAANLDPVLITAFPMNTDEEKKLFKLLNDAYIKARYKRGFKVTREELEYLANCTKKLMNLTEKICTQKIDSFV